jgi:hypothetical protein
MSSDRLQTIAMTLQTIGRPQTSFDSPLDSVQDDEGMTRYRHAEESIDHLDRKAGGLMVVRAKTALFSFEGMNLRDP